MNPLVAATREFESALLTAPGQKTAGAFEGPYKHVDEHTCMVWLAMDSYGRVHHVTGDIKAAEKVMERVQQKLIAEQNALGDQGIYFRGGFDIFIDGLKGGRNRMILNFHVFPLQGSWTPEQQDAIRDSIRAQEKAPPK